MWKDLSTQLQTGNFKALARCISLVENEQEGYMQFLQQLPSNDTRIIGITGPPGAGKSTIADTLIEVLIEGNRKVGVLCIDPSSPFNFGALLGDRIRMSQWYTHPNVYIRSLANHGSMGGLSPMIIEITALLKAAAFDHIIIETVGIGQSEVEIAGLADITVVVLVPEAGDEIQTMKAGLMEIADIFVVNKGDRPDADHFVKTLKQLLAPAYSRQIHEIPVIKTIASEKIGINKLADAIIRQNFHQTKEKRTYLLTRKAWHILQRMRMKDLDIKQIEELIAGESEKKGFNLFRLVDQINSNTK